MRTLEHLDVEGRRVLVRVDFNVPLGKDAEGRTTVADDTRIVAALATIEELRSRGASLVLVSHLGRPEGRREEDLSLAPVVARLAELTDAPVALAPTVVGEQAKALAEQLGAGELLVLENVRFEPGETSNDPALARALAELADVYVNDAFGAAHRAHASTEGVAHLLPSAAGRLLEREVATLAQILEKPARPLVAVIGGAKVADKIGVIDRFLELADVVIIGGAMCFPFLCAQGHSVGESLCDDEDVEHARRALAKATDPSRASVELPSDLVIGDRLAPDAEHRVLDGVEVPPGWMGLDIGPRSAERYAQEIERAGIGVLERADGRVRVGAVRRRHAPRGRSRRTGARRDRRRRRRLRRGARAVRAGGRRRPPLDRRRRDARARRGAQAAGRAGARRRGRSLVSAGRTPLIAGNWKMHKTEREAEDYIQALLPRVSAIDGVDVAICVPFTDLRAMVDSARGSRVEVYAQNMHHEPEGAFTGEVSPPMLQDVGAQGVVLGHSERRELFGESDRALALKVPAALDAGLLPILCVGETESERENEETDRKLRQQVKEDLGGVPSERLADVTIAYEPIWAIGTGKVASPDQAQEAIAFIRALVGDRDAQAAERVRILYGGSVKPDNAAQLMALPDVDGALVGGASLQADSFAEIVGAAAAQ